MAPHDTFEDDLSLLLDGDLGAERVGELDRHLAGCASCRAVLEDLRQIRAAARRLGPIVPPASLAGELRRRLEVRTSTPGAGAVSLTRGRGLRWTALAATLALIAGGIAIVHVGRPADRAVPAASVEGVTDTLNVALAHYARAVAELETIAEDQQSGIDPAVRAVLDRNLQEMDQAIDESRAALAEHPDDEPARETLFQALDEKVLMLQTTIALIGDVAPPDRAPLTPHPGGRTS